MKPRLTYWHGCWWCKFLFVTGCGPTPESAWEDMWNLYGEAIRPKISACGPRVRP